MHRVISFAIAVLAVVAAIGCVELAGDRIDTTYFNRPWIVVNQRSGYPWPDEPEQFSTGLVVSVWRDGTILRAHNARTVGRSNRYSLGKLDPSSMLAIQQYLQTSGILSGGRFGTLVPDAPDRLITVEVSPNNYEEWLDTLEGNRSPMLRNFTDLLLSLPLSSSRVVWWRQESRPSW